MKNAIKVIRHADPLLSVYRGETYIGLIFPPIHNGHQDWKFKDFSFSSEEAAISALIADFDA